MNGSVFLAELTSAEYAEKLRSNPPVFLPLGATEQHGPHMSMNVDVLLPTAVCERVAREVGGLVAPTIPYGAKSMPRSGGGESFPGTTSLDAHTLTLVIRDVIRGLGRDGVRRIAVVVGHYENAAPSFEGVDLGLRELAREGVADMQAMRFDYWDFYKPETHHRIWPEGYPGIALEHAAMLETSLMLLLRPEFVDEAGIPDHGHAEFPPYDVWPVPAGFVPATGVLARTTGASAEKGRWLMDDHVELISKAVRTAFGM